MAKLGIPLLSTSKIIRVYLTTLSTGAALPGVLFGDITARYWIEGAAGSVAVTLAAMTPGTWATGGFAQMDAVNMPGWYEFSVPNAAFASGKSVGIQFKANIGTSLGMANCNVEIQEDTSCIVQFPIHKNTSLPIFQFPMTLSSDHITPYTGAGNTISGKSVLDGASFVLTNSASITAVAGVNGVYFISLTTADLNGNSVCLIFSAATCDDTKIFFTTQS